MKTRAKNLRHHARDGRAGGGAARRRRAGVHPVARMKGGLDLIEYPSPFTGAAAWLIDAFDEDMYGGSGTHFDWN